MKHLVRFALPALVMLSACSEKAEEAAEPQRVVAASPEMVSDDGAAPQNKFGFRQDLEQPTLLRDKQAEARTNADKAAANAAVQADPAAAPAAAARIAYAYSFGFRVAANSLPDLQRSHADLCKKMGPQSCRVMEMSQSGADEDYAYGKLLLEVAAPQAQGFGAQLEKIAQGLDSEQISSAVSGEDLSKQIVDTEAKLRARVLLRDRLMELLATRKGTVAELIEAERGVAEVNQEIDEAQSWLKELQGRVEFSKVTIEYESENRSGSSFLSPIKAVLGSLGMIFGGVIAGLIALTVALVPISLFVVGVRWLWRRVRRLLQGGSATP